VNFIDFSLENSEILLLINLNDNESENNLNDNESENKSENQEVPEEIKHSESAEFEDEKEKQEREKRNRLKEKYNKYKEQKDKFYSIWENSSTTEMTEFYEALIEAQKDFEIPDNDVKEILDEDEKGNKKEVSNPFEAIGMVFGGLTKGIEKGMENSDGEGCIII